MASESRQEKVIRNMGSSSGFCYSTSTSDVVSPSNLVVNQMQSFESNHGADQLYNLTTGMEMLAFPSKNNNNRSSDSATNSSVLWKGFFSKQQPTTSSNNPSCSFYQSHDDHHHQFINKPDFSNGLISETTNTTSHENLIGAVASDSSSWQDNTNNNNNNTNRLIIDDSSLRCVFPSDQRVVQSHQGLSLSLSSNNPSSTGLQSFELRETNHHHHHPHQQHEDGFFGKSPNFQQQQHQQQQQQQNQIMLKYSKYSVPAQELLNEFCNLGTKQPDQQKQKLQKINQLEDENGSGSSGKQSFVYSLDLLELQKRKTKLVSMLEEVDRRYRQYCDQMKAVVSTFEGVLGDGAASMYSTLASKAMSKHFRCLRDGIVDQIKGIKKAMGEKDPVAPGTTKGDTPRLRLLDQTLRQQRAFQQMSMMESHPWRPQRGLPERSVSVLRAWLFEHFLHPYPSDVDKHILARQTGLSRSQVSNWFINARVRLWKPMVEEMYLEETKEQDSNIASSSSIDWVTGGSLLDENSRPNQNPNHQNPHLLQSEDQKPTPDQLVRGDSESLSSIINIPAEKSHDTDQNNHHLYHHYHQQQQQQQEQHHQLQQHRRMQLGRVPNENFGVVDLDFASYNNEGVNQSNLGNGVSLTLGLQQHGGNGMSLSFSPVSQHSLFFPRDHIGDCDEQVQYSILDGEEASTQNLPYRNLMGAQLLHDLAG